MKTKLFILCITIAGLLHQSKAQIITTVVGNGTGSYSGDGGAATAAEINRPMGIACDAAGNLYIADTYNNVIRKVNTTGVISTYAGTGTAAYGGDGGQATAAQLNGPGGVNVDTAGNLYIVDTYNNRIRKVDASGIITTIAGTGTPGFSGDGGRAVSAEIFQPSGMAIDVAGNLYIADYTNRRIRIVNTLGIISTIAGNGTGGYSGDGGPATSAELNSASGVAVDTMGNVFICDPNNGRVRMVNSSGIITTVVGNGQCCSVLGDGGQATAAQISQPFSANFDVYGNLFIADWQNGRIRKVNTLGIISTVAGTNMSGFSGDGGSALAAELHDPFATTFDASGNLYIADGFNNRIRKITNVVSTGIQEVKENIQQVSIYPNPNNGIFNISYANNINELKVSNMLGQLVYDAKPQTTKTTLALENEGVYFITITSGAVTNTQKVIVSK